MNWKFPVSAASSLAALLLVSCGHFGRKSANQIIIRNPTVADVQKLEAEWGMQPKPVSTGTTSTTVSETGGGAPTVTTTSTTSTTTAPAETPPVTPPAVPPSLR